MMVAAPLSSDERATSRRPAPRDLIALAFLASLVLLTRGIWFGDPVADFDEQLYSFIGWRIQQGELPYVDWWDRKPFGLFALYGAAHWLLGPGALAYQIVAAAFTLAGAWLTYDLARLLVDRFAAAISAAIMVMLLAAYGSYSGQSEVFFTPLMLAMVRLLAFPSHPRFAQRALLAMFVGGLALQIKYTVLPQCLLLGLYALWRLHRNGMARSRLARFALVFVLAGLAPTLLVALGYFAAGHFEAFYFANFESFFERLPAPQGRWVAEHALGVAPLAILVIGGIYAAFRMNPPRDWPLWWLFTGWALATLAGALLPGTVFLYYYAALAAPAALVALPLLDRRGPLRGALGLLLALACLAILSLADRRAQSLAEREAAHALAGAIAPHVDDRRECLWLFDGPSALYRLTDSCVPTRFVYPDHLNNALETPALGIDQTAEVARVLATRPAAIVTASRPMTLQNAKATRLVERTLARGYVASASARMHGRTLTVWLRSDLASR